MRQIKSREYRKFVEADAAFELWRLADEEYRLLRHQSLPIRWDGLVLMELQSIDTRAGRWLMLPKVLVALEADYGPCSTDIDREKQTFAFRSYCDSQSTVNHRSICLRSPMFGVA
jgi:hypothetical protein